MAHDNSSDPALICRRCGVQVKYGSNGGSSGQNSVTGMNTQIDANSMWKVVAAAS